MNPFIILYGIGAAIITALTLPLAIRAYCKRKQRILDELLEELKRLENGRI